MLAFNSIAIVYMSFVYEGCSLKSCLFNCHCLLTCSYPYLFCSTLVTIPFWRCQRGRICWCISSYVTIYIVMFVCSFWCISFTQCFRGD